MTTSNATKPYQATPDTVRAYVLDVPGAVQKYREYALPPARDRKVGAQGLVNPPVDLAALADFFNESTWHSNAVKAKARDVVGHGWRLEPEFAEGEEPEGAAQEKEVLDSFFWNGGVEAFIELDPLDEPVPIASSLSDVAGKLLTDFDSIGNGYLVVIREDRASGPPQWYAHQNGAKIRVHKDRARFRWKDGAKVHWFKRFGLPVDVHIKTGDIHRMGSLALKDRAPEIIPFTTYTPTDDYYGLPEITPAIGALLMDLLARDFNIKFFDNNAIPQYAVVFEGLKGQLEDDVVDVVTNFFQVTAKENPHSTLVLETPPKLAGDQPGKIVFEKVAVDIKDGHFKLLRESSRDEVLSAHAVPGYRLGLAIEGNLGGTNIREADEIYKFQEVDTRREMLEEKINRLIIRQGFGIENWSLRFNEFDTSDAGRQVDIWAKRVQHALATPNQAIEALDGERVEDRPELDDYYWGGRPLGDLAAGDTFDLFAERERLVAARSRPRELSRGGDGSRN